MTIQEILNDAFQELGVLATGETLSAEMSQSARKKLNLMLGSWSIRNVSMLVTVFAEFTLTPDDGTYTIGPTGNFVATRPVKIINASVRDSNNIYTPLELIGEDQYLSFNDRDTLSSIPSMLWYQPTLTNGTIRLYAKPTQADTLQLSMQVPFAAVATLDEEFVADDAYLEAVVYNLAVRLAPGYGVTPSPLVLDTARDLFDRLLNYSAPDMTTFVDSPLRQRKANSIYTIE